MTEQEAITVFEEILAIDYKDTIPKYYEAMELAVNDMKEVQKYRAIGALDELNSLIAQSAQEFNMLIEYISIGTVDECRAAVEKQKNRKESESHDEKYILKHCIWLIQEIVDEFAEWYKWIHGEDAISELDEEERFCVRKSYFKIVQKLFLFNTRHSGGTSTREKCKQLGVDGSEEITFDWSDKDE